MWPASMTYPAIPGHHDKALAASPGVIHPSQVINIETFIWQVGIGSAWVWLFSLVPASWHVHWGFAAALPVLLALRAIWVMLQTRCLRYSFDGERISWIGGVLARASGSIEAHRIQTIYMQQSFIERLANVGTVMLETQDGTGQSVMIVGAKEPEQLRAWLTAYVRRARQQGGFQEVFVG